MLRRAWPTTIAVLAVLAVYVFFGSGGTWAFRRVPWYQRPALNGNHYYASLAEGFRNGKLSMAHTPEPRLVAMPNPYDVHARIKQGIDYLWDASYYKGRYYLYFTPVPALLFYLPYRVAGGAYPPDTLVFVFFSAWAFIMSVAFVRRALAGRKRFLPMWFWVLLIGLGNIIPFQMAEARTYEVAIVTGTAMSATWAWALLRFLETRSRRHAALMGFWLAMTIASRPNLIVLLAIAALVLFRERRAVIASALVPLTIVGALLMAYNAARFGNPFELGVRYQLTFADMKDHRVCSLCSGPEVIRVINSANHYVFAAPAIGSEFPFLDFSRARLDPAVAFPIAGPEHVVGIGALVPLTLAATLIALLFAVMRGRPPDDGARAATLMMVGGWLALFALSACWWVTARYALDFMLLMVAATVVLIERGLTALADAGAAILPLRGLVVVLGIYSILISICGGFLGANGYFEGRNPKLYETLKKQLSMNRNAE